MPGLPAPALVFFFAAAPSLVLTPTLRDAKGTLAFGAPASLITTGAALLSALPLDSWVAAAIITAGAILIVIPILRRAMRRNHLLRPALR
jgi:hypothetical protein